MKVAYSFLADTHLPKKFWYWAPREANICSNIFLIIQKANNIANPDYLTTPYYGFFGKKTDYCILFSYGAIRSFCCVCNGNIHCNKFSLQCLLGISLGCSEFTIGVFF